MARRCRAAAGSATAAAALALALALVAPRAALAQQQQQQQQQAPPSANPYANVNWSGCEDGFCPPVDLAVEQKFYAAAAAGDVPLLRAMLREHAGGAADGAAAPAAAAGRAALNLTRNIVPDDNGHARVLDVAVWAAVRAGKGNALRLLFQALPDAKQAEEEGHLVELAADNAAANSGGGSNNGGADANGGGGNGNGNGLDVLELLLDAEDPDAQPRFSKGGLDMPTGPSALALAALKGNVPAMRLLLERDTERVRREVAAAGRVTRPPLDLKAGMGAASRSGSVEAIRAMVEAGGMAAVHHPATGKRSVHDWQGEFVEEALGAAAAEARASWRRALVPLRPPPPPSQAAAGNATAAGNAAARAAEASTAARGSLETALRLLLEGGNYTVPWAVAQGLVASAARAGDPGALAALFEQPTVGGDADELAEAAQRALGVAAEEGQAGVVSWVLANHPLAAAKACGTALRRAIMYDHPAAAAAVLTAGGGACASARVTAAAARLGSFQDASWIGAVLGAARRGANDVLEALLAAKATSAAGRASELLGALHTARSAGDDAEEEGDGGGGKAPPRPPPRADRDPLAAAAARGDARAVRALLPFSSGLCASCAAVEAARAGHLELLELLTKGEEEQAGGDKGKGGAAAPRRRRGVAASVLEQESTGGATDGLRCLAQALDQGQWGAIEWLAREHQKGLHLLAYFLPAVAQHVDEGNMRRLIGVLERAILLEEEEEGEEKKAGGGAGSGGDDAAGADGGGGGGGGDKKAAAGAAKKRRAPRLRKGLDPTELQYVRDQVHSATVSAALKGTPDVLAALQGSRLGRALAAEGRRQRAAGARREAEEARMREQEREFIEKRRREDEAEAAAKKKQEL